MATRQPNNPVEIQDWMTQFIDLLRDIHELEASKTKEDQFVFRVTKLATTFNREWFRDVAKLEISVMRLGGDRESERLRKLVIDVLNQVSPLKMFVIDALAEDLQEERPTTEEKLRYAAAREAALLAFKNIRSLGTEGKRTWTRDELHER